MGGSGPVEVPSFAFGRPGYDNWLVRHVVARGIPVVDATQVVVAAHQAHEYSHVKESSAAELLESAEDRAWATATQQRGERRPRDVWERMASDEISRNLDLA